MFSKGGQGARIICVIWSLGNNNSVPRSAIKSHRPQALANNVNTIDKSSQCALCVALWHCCAEPCFWHFCQSINTGALSAEIQDTQITLSLLHLTWEPSTHINSYRRALYNDENSNNSKFLGKRKAYICGWTYPEYSLARTCSVFRFQHFERSQ